MHFQKLVYSLCTMFVIVEKMIFLRSFDVRLAHAGTSVIFSYLIFHNLKFCLHKFKGLITIKKCRGFENFATFLHAKFSWTSSPLKLCILVILRRNIKFLWLHLQCVYNTCTVFLEISKWLFCGLLHHGHKVIRNNFLFLMTIIGYW